MIRNRLLACLAVLTLLAAVRHAEAMPSNYPELDDRKVETLTVETKTLPNDPDPKIIIENKYLRLVVEAEHGAIISSYYDKTTKTEFTKKAVPGDNFGGIFRNYSWSADGMKDTDWESVKYAAQITANADTASVHLSAKGRFGLMTGITLNKTYTLRADEQRLRIDYDIENSNPSPEPISFALQVHNTVGIAGVKGWYFWPLDQGVHYQDAPGGVQEFIPNPTRGWLGYVSVDGVGLAFLPEYRLVDKYYYWNAGGVYPRGTLEWYLNKLPLSRGGAIKTTAWAYPFHGIKRPNGVATDAIGQIDTTGVNTVGVAGAIHISLCSPADAKRDLVLRVRKLPDGPWLTIKSQPVHFEPDKTLDLSADYTPPVGGSYAVMLAIQDAGKEVGRMDSPMIVGRADEQYHLAALEKRYSPLDEPKKSFDFDFTSMRVVTPHVAWAVPWAGGTASFLFLTDGFHQREAVELAQRFDFTASSSFLTANLDPAAFQLGDFDTDITQNDLISQMQQVYADHRDLNVLLLSGPVWKWFTPWMRTETIKRVQAGMGLVWIDPRATTPDIDAIMPTLPLPAGARAIKAQWQPTNEHFIPRGLPLDAQPVTAMMPLTLIGEDSTAVAFAKPTNTGQPIPLVAVRQAGQGRVVILNYATNDGPSAGHRITPVSPVPDYSIQEYQLGLVARAMFWASSKESPAAIESIDAPADGKPLTVHFNAEQPVKASLQATFRDHFYGVIHQQDIPVSLAQGKSTVAVDEPGLPNGVNFVDLILTAEGKTLDWHSRTIHVTNSAGLAGLKTDQQVYDMGKPVKLAVQVNGGDNDMRVRFRLTDTDGRIVFESLANPNDGQASVIAAIARPSTIRLIASADLLTGKGRVLDTQRCNIDYRYVPSYDDLSVTFAWPGVSEGGMAPYLVRPMYEALARLGATGWQAQPGVTRPDEIDSARAADLPVEMTDAGLTLGKQPFAGAHLAAWEHSRNKLDLVRDPCLSDPAIIANLKDAVTRAAQSPSLNYGAADISLGSDNVFAQTGFDLCFGPESLKAMRVWLQSTYGSIDVLNREWDTNFASWDKVVPMTRDEVAAQKSWAGWLDHRVFEDKTFADTFHSARAAVDAALPGTRTSARGTQDTESLVGYDWWLLSKSLTALDPYLGEQTIQQRSFMPDAPANAWIGFGSANSAALRQAAWSALFGGMVRSFAVSSGRDYVNPDLTLPEPATAMRQVLARMNHGVARALFAAKPRLDPILFHYSPRSLWTQILYDDVEPARHSAAGMTALLDAAGLQYGYIAYEQLEQGTLDKSNARVLFLRHSTALSDKEAAAIRAFVERGGVLVADLLPGVLDEHGKPRAAPALDDVLGIKQTGQLEHGSGTLTAAGQADGLLLPQVSCTIDCAAPVTLTTGLALGSWQIDTNTGPAMVVNRFGKGSAIYLATDALGAYRAAEEVRNAPRGQAVVEPMETFLGSLLARAAIKPAVVTLDEAGKPFPAGIYRFEGEHVNFIGIVDPPGVHDTGRITVHLASPSFIYDVLTGTALKDRPADQATLAFAPQDVHLLALLDYAPRKIDLTVPAHGTPGEPITLDIALDCGPAAAGEGVANHVFRVDTTGPGGSPLRPLTGNFTSDHGKLKLIGDLALNEAPGIYTVIVREAITGLTASGKFTVP